MQLLKTFFQSYIFAGLAVVLILALALNNTGDSQVSNRVLAEQDTANLGGEESLILEEQKSTQDEKNSTEPLTSSVAAQNFASSPDDIETLQHGSCLVRAQFGYPSSDTFNPDTPYLNSFVRYGTGLQNLFLDVNGDSLPDYVYAQNSHHDGGSTNELRSEFFGCVYLNNGQGWDMAMECYALTITDLDTNTVLTRDYRGTCAGTPSGN